MILKSSKYTGTIPLTEARARLFRLVEDLLSGRADRIAVSLRGNDDEVLLVRARDFERMEEELASLRQRVAPEPRPLRGLGQIIGPPDAVLAGVRSEQQAHLDAKLGQFAGEALAAVSEPRQATRARKPSRDRK